MGHRRLWLGLLGIITVLMAGFRKKLVVPLKLCPVQKWQQNAFAVRIDGVVRSKNRVTWMEIGKNTISEAQPMIQPGTIPAI
jgi:hypothetical protein